MKSNQSVKSKSQAISSSTKSMAPEINFSAAGFVDDYLPALLAQASFLISSEFHKVVRRQHLSVSEWRVLATLASVDAAQNFNIGELARIALMKQSTLTRLLDRMVLVGYVERFNGAEDRRITHVRITPSGLQLVELLIVLARDHEKRVLEPFGIEAGQELKKVLKRMIDMHKNGEPIDFE